MKYFWPTSAISLLLASAFLSGCSEPPKTEQADPIRPVKTHTVTSSGLGAIRDFPGKVEASQRAELGFRISGTVNKLLVREGDLVKTGDVLAALDDTDFKIDLADKTATFENARRNFLRAKELIKTGAISRFDYDKTESSFRSAEAALKGSKQRIIYSELKAPFDGQIALRHIDNFEEITAKQNIFDLQGTDQVDVVINVPENIVRQVERTGAIIKPGPSEVPILARFKGHKNKQYPLNIKEIATKADSETQTFQVRLTMPSPKDLVILSGMTTTVSVDFAKLSSAAPVFWVPASAVAANAGLNAQVWQIDPSTMVVKAIPVTLGAMRGDQAEILSGLSGGEEIVAVGAAYLSAGMKISRVKKTEQAEPRASDPAPAVSEPAQQ